MRHWANNVLTQNTVILNPGDTTLVVQDDSTFPNNTVPGFSFGAGDVFKLTMRSSLTAASPNEILLVTGNPSGTSYNVTRAQEDTTAQQWVVGSVVAGQLTAEAVNEYEQGTGTVNPVNTGDSILGDGDATPLDINFGPDAFGLGGASILLDNTDDLDTITNGGDYHWHVSSVPSNSPTNQNATMHVVGGSDIQTGSQFVVSKSNNVHWRHKFGTLGWGVWQTALRQVSSNNTLLGTGTPTSPLGVNTGVFETQINTDNTLLGDGGTQNLLRASAVRPIIREASSGSGTINVSEFTIEGSVLWIAGSGSDFDLTFNFDFTNFPVGQFISPEKGIKLVNVSNATVSIIAGNNVNFVTSPVGSDVDVPPNSGLIHLHFGGIFTPIITGGLAISGAVVATP